MKKIYKVSPETLERMRAAQQKRMAEGRHNFHKGHALYGGGIAENMRGKPSSMKGRTHSPETRERLRAIGKERFQDPAERERLSQLQTGRKQSPETIAKRFASRAGYRHSEETRRKMSEAQKGAKSHRWKGGVSAEHEIIRKSAEFKLWREAVFARDDWTCQHCGQRGGELHPDHIKPFAQHPELRFDLDNGRTLCRECHMKTDTWGAGPKTRKDSFISSLQC